MEPLRCWSAGVVCCGSGRHLQGSSFVYRVATSAMLKFQKRTAAKIHGVGPGHPGSITCRSLGMGWRRMSVSWRRCQASPTVVGAKFTQQHVQSSAHYIGPPHLPLLTTIMALVLLHSGTVPVGSRPRNKASHRRSSSRARARSSALPCPGLPWLGPNSSVAAPIVAS